MRGRVVRLVGRDVGLPWGGHRGEPCVSILRRKETPLTHAVRLLTPQNERATLPTTYRLTPFDLPSNLSHPSTLLKLVKLHARSVCSGRLLLLEQDLRLGIV